MQGRESEMQQSPNAFCCWHDVSDLRLSSDLSTYYANSIGSAEISELPVMMHGAYTDSVRLW